MAFSWNIVIPALAAAALLPACTVVGPAYQRPKAAAPPAFKEAPPAGAGWFPAASAVTLDRGPRWELFGDAELNRLVAQVRVSNQNVAAAVANHPQARAIVAQQRASLFPLITTDGSARRSGGRGAAGTASAFRPAWAPAGRPMCGARCGSPSRAPRRARRRARPTSRRRGCRRRASSRSTTSRCATPTPSSAGCGAPSRPPIALPRSRRTAATPASRRAPTCCRPRPSSPARAPTCRA